MITGSAENERHSKRQPIHGNHDRIAGACCKRARQEDQARGRFFVSTTIRGTP
jgi:hypothetical protein